MRGRSQDRGQLIVIRKVFNSPLKKGRRKELRNAGTAAEVVLWTKLQKRQVLGKKFRRQQSVGPYIVDFFCPECGLIVELDGAPHFGFFSDQYDAERTRYFEGLGLMVIRFENKYVHRGIEGVLEQIREAIRNRSRGTGRFPEKMVPLLGKRRGRRAE